MAAHCSRKLAGKFIHQWVGFPACVVEDANVFSPHDEFQILLGYLIHPSRAESAYEQMIWLVVRKCVVWSSTPRNAMITSDHGHWLIHIWEHLKISLNAKGDQHMTESALIGKSDLLFENIETTRRCRKSSTHGSLDLREN